MSRIAQVLSHLLEWGADLPDEEPVIPSTAIVSTTEEVFVRPPPRSSEEFHRPPAKPEGDQPWLGQPWWYPSITRVQAMELLTNQGVGAFVVRASSSGGAALTFLQADGVIGHGLLVKSEQGWSVENIPPYQPTLLALLQTHSGLTYSQASFDALRARCRSLFGEASLQEKPQQPTTTPTTPHTPAPTPATSSPAPPTAAQPADEPQSIANDGVTSTSNDTNNTGAALCARCVAVPSVLTCSQCQLILCKNCSAALHDTGPFSGHVLIQGVTASGGAAPPKTPRIPSQNDYINEKWYRPDWNRLAAEEFLRTSPAGSFGVRPSSQANSLALSHTKPDGTVGHAILHLHNGQDGHYGYSIEDRGVYYDTLSDLLHGLSDLRFDLLDGANATQGDSSQKPALSASLATSVGFSPFLPRKVGKDASGNFEPSVFSSSGSGSGTPTVSSPLSAALTPSGPLIQSEPTNPKLTRSDSDHLYGEGSIALNTVTTATTAEPPSDDVVAEPLPPAAPPTVEENMTIDDDTSEYTTIPSFESHREENPEKGLFELPPPPTQAQSESYLAASTQGYSHLPEDNELPLGQSGLFTQLPLPPPPNQSTPSVASEYSEIKLPSEEECQRILQQTQAEEKLRAEQKQNRHSVRLSLALDALAALAGDALDDNSISNIADVTPQSQPTTPRSKLCDACNNEKAAKRVTMSDGSKVKLCRPCTDSIRQGDLILTRDEKSGQIQCAVPPSPQHSTVTGRGLTGVPVGRRADFLVVGYSKPGVRCEIGGALLRAKVTEPSGTELKLRLVDHGNGTYTLATRVRQPGIHALHVELQKTPSGKAFGVGKSPYVWEAFEPHSGNAGSCDDCQNSSASATYVINQQIFFLCAKCVGKREQAGQRGQVSLLPPAPKMAGAAMSAAKTASNLTKH